MVCNMHFQTVLKCPVPESMHISKGEYVKRAKCFQRKEQSLSGISGEIAGVQIIQKTSHLREDLEMFWNNSYKMSYLCNIMHIHTFLVFHQVVPL